MVGHVRRGHETWLARGGPADRWQVADGEVGRRQRDDRRGEWAAKQGKRLARPGRDRRHGVDGLDGVGDDGRDGVGDHGVDDHGIDDHGIDGVDGVDGPSATGIVRSAGGEASVDLGMDQPFAAGGVMGRLMAAKDWGATPLGRVEQWSPSLRTAVGICLESRFAMTLVWGPELVFLYNDADIPVLGGKHPDALGRPFREVWSEYWDFIGPMCDQVMSGGGATWSQDVRQLLFRHGYLEECYFTFSLSAIRDAQAGGRVAGILTTGQETTRQMVDNRRLGCLRELATPTPRRDQRVVCEHAVAVMGRHTEDVPYGVLLLGDRRAPRSAPRYMGSWGLADERAAAELLGALEPGPGGLVPELGDATSTGRARVVRGLADRCPLRLADGSPPSSSAVVVPFANGGDGRPVGLVLVGVSDLLALDDEYRNFVDLVAGQISAAVVSARAAEAERASAADARHRALHDGLTGLPNRTSLFDRLGRALARAKGQGDSDRVGLLFVDLDGFKAVNDTLGHRAGDELLREVAVRLRRAVRPGDTVARLAGDEFAVLCERVADPGVVATVADRIVRTVAVPPAAGGRTVTSSVGVALSGPDLAEPDKILHAADIAMYAAKRQGRNRRVLFDESMQTRVPSRRRDEQAG